MRHIRMQGMQHATQKPFPQGMPSFGYNQQLITQRKEGRNHTHTHTHTNTYTQTHDGVSTDIFISKHTKVLHTHTHSQKTVFDSRRNR